MMKFKKTLITTATLAVAGFASIAQAGVLKDTFGAEIVGTKSNVEAAVLDAGCNFTSKLKNSILNKFKNGGTTELATQLGFSTAVAADFLYGGTSVNSSVLTNFINIQPNGAITAICPFPLQGHSPEGTELTYCGHSDGDGGYKAYIAGSSSGNGPLKQAVENLPTADQPTGTEYMEDTPGNLRFSGIRLFPPNFPDETHTFLPTINEGGGPPATHISYSTTPEDWYLHFDYLESTIYSPQVCPSGASVDSTKSCLPSRSEENGKIKNVAEYQIFQITETSRASTAIDNTLWHITWQYMNPHEDPDSRENISYIRGSLDVFHINGSEHKVFDNEILDAAPECGFGGFVKSS